VNKDVRKVVHYTVSGKKETAVF